MDIDSYLVILIMSSNRHGSSAMGLLPLSKPGKLFPHLFISCFLILYFSEPVEMACVEGIIITGHFTA